MFVFNPELIGMFSLIYLSGFGLGFKLGLVQKITSSIITGG